jgi:transposase InsO family protein
LFRLSGRPLAEIARDLGVATESLRGWVRQAGIDAGRREGLSSEEREELRRLRRENRVLRDVLQKPNRLWRSDIKEIPSEGKLNLATVIDSFSRRVVGWSMHEHMRAELVVEALEMAVSRRRPAAGVIAHSDQG